MQITALETIRCATQPNVCLLRLHTDDGVVGLGESFFDAATVETYLHDAIAPLLLGRRPPEPERAAAMFTSYVGYQGGGVETRARGALDIALWDLLGRRTGLRVADLLGGPVRDSIGIYNTCAGPGYVSTTSRQEAANWGVDGDPTPGTPASQGARRYEDLDAFLHRPAELARDLHDEGVPGMKVWPFDTYAEESGGTSISDAGLAAGLEVIEAIRAAVPADQLRLMVELHGLWNRPTAARICRALEPYQPFWVEDPIRPDAVDALAALRDETGLPVATGETVVGRRGFLPLLRADAVDVVTVDVGWTGGLTEARKVAVLADTFGIPIAPHDCSGPVSFAACCHLVLSQPNGLVQETVRAFLRTWYTDLVEGLPVVADGVVRLSTEPGLGVRLAPDLGDRPDVERRVTDLQD